ncbi:MAG: hypothetical protein R2822_01725 [Spirosomataceae bacterium]
MKEANLSLPPDGALYLILSHEQTNIIFPISSIRNDIITMLKQQQYFKNGVEAEAYDCAQSLKDFQVNWLKVGKQPVLYHTNTTIFTR